MNPDETPLTGGTQSVVVRVGATVRRSAGPWTAPVQALLRHVRARGFELAPEALGRDEDGREVLGYIEGETAGWTVPWPPWVRADSILEQVGRSLARYHHAASDFLPPGAPEWKLGPRALQPGEVVCHNDLAPYNVVVDGGRLVGIIDWDLARPGPPISDLAFAAWQWVPLHDPAVTAYLGWDPSLDRRARLTRLLDAYGLADRAGFVERVVERIEWNIDVMAQRAAAGDPAYRALIEQGHLAGMERARGFVEANAGRLAP